MLDSNIIAGVWLGNAAAKAALANARRTFTLVISPIVHSELFAHPRSTEDEITVFLERTNISIAPMSSEVLTLAGRRFATYADRRRQAEGGSPRRIAADFIIGAHAMSVVSVLVTLDKRFFERNLPELRLAGS